MASTGDGLTLKALADSAGPHGRHRGLGLTRSAFIGASVCRVTDRGQTECYTYAKTRSPLFSSKSNGVRHVFHVLHSEFPASENVRLACGPCCCRIAIPRSAIQPPRTRRPLRPKNFTAERAESAEAYMSLFSTFSTVEEKSHRRARRGICGFLGDLCGRVETSGMRWQTRSS